MDSITAITLHGAEVGLESSVIELGPKVFSG